MTTVYSTEHDTKSYGVKIENIELVKVQKFKIISDKENNILCVKPSEIFLGRYNVINMLVKSGNLEKSLYSGNTMFFKKLEENKKNRYVYIGADIIYSFITTDHILQYISNVGDNLIPFSIAIGKENIYFLSPNCKYIKREKNKNIELLETNGISIDPFNYHLEEHGPNRFEKLLDFTCIHSC